MASIRVRLTAWNGSVLALVLGLFAAAAYLFLERLDNGEPPLQVVATQSLLETPELLQTARVGRLATTFNHVLARAERSLSSSSGAPRLAPLTSSGPGSAHPGGG